MQPWVIDLNDARVTVADRDRVLAASPGYAIARPHDLLLGAAAFANACAHPRQTINTFWAQFDAAPLPVPGAPLRTAAEYIHAHLNEVVSSAGGNADQPLILAPPAHFDRQRLALLLGIVQQCQFRAVGLVDAAVAAAAGLHMPGDCLHVEISLHGATLSRISRVDDCLQRTAEETLATGGWVMARAALIRSLSERFVAVLRFDPRRHAATEQQLHVALDALLAAVRQVAGDSAELPPDFPLELTHGGARQQIMIAADGLAAPLRHAQLQVLAAARRLAPHGASVLLSPLAALLPGLADLLATLGPVHGVPDTGVAAGALEYQELIVHDGAALPLVRRLPAGQDRSHARLVPQMRAPRAVERQRQFALLGSQLHALTDIPLQIAIGRTAAPRTLNLGEGPARIVGELASTSGQTLLLPGDTAHITVNGVRANGVVPLTTGDIIALQDGPASFRIVELASDAP